MEIKHNHMAVPWLAVGAAASGLAGTLGNIGARRKTHKRNIELWKMDNAYNHPSAQMARLREAGLNPNLVYGGGVSGASGQSSGPPPTAEKPPINIGNPIAKYQAVKSTELQSDNLRAQNTVLQNDALLKSAQTLKTMAESNIKGTESNILSQTAQHIIRDVQRKSDMTVMKAHTMGQEYQINDLSQKQFSAVKKASFEARIKRLSQVGQNLSNSQKIGELRQAELDLKAKNMSYYDTNAILTIISQILGLRK